MISFKEEKMLQVLKQRLRSVKFNSYRYDREDIVYKTLCDIGSCFLDTSLIYALRLHPSTNLSDIASLYAAHYPEEPTSQNPWPAFDICVFIKTKDTAKQRYRKMVFFCQMLCEMINMYQAGADYVTIDEYMKKEREKLYE